MIYKTRNEKSCVETQVEFRFCEALLNETCGINKIILLCKSAHCSSMCFTSANKGYMENKLHNFIHVYEIIVHLQYL